MSYGISQICIIAFFYNLSQFALCIFKRRNNDFEKNQFFYLEFSHSNRKKSLPHNHLPFDITF